MSVENNKVLKAVYLQILEEGELLLLLDHSSGCIRLVGGLVEDGESEVHALQRHLSNQLGVSISADQLQLEEVRLYHYRSSTFDVGKRAIEEALFTCDCCPDTDDVRTGFELMALSDLDGSEKLSPIVEYVLNQTKLESDSDKSCRTVVPLVG